MELPAMSDVGVIPTIETTKQIYNALDDVVTMKLGLDWKNVYAACADGCNSAQGVISQVR